jgi:hypothetical protein
MGPRRVRPRWYDGRMHGGTLLAGALGLTAACFASPPAALPCGPNLACPAGLVCQAGMCAPATGPDAVDMVDAGGNGDGDGDGVVDVVDNCPGASNSDQHDEDGDAAGDPCDPCPFLAPIAGQSGDGDGDGLPDYCDPRPSEAGDRLLLFLSMHQPDPVLRLGGSATLEGDRLVITSTDAGSIVRILSPTGEDVVRIAGEVLALGPTTAQRQLAVSTSVAGTNRVYCEVYRGAGPTATPGVKVTRFVGGAYDTLASTPTELVTGPLAFTLDASVARQQLGCQHAGGTMAPVSAQAVVPLVPGPELRLNMQGMGLAVDYLAQFTHPP